MTEEQNNPHVEAYPSKIEFERIQKRIGVGYIRLPNDQNGIKESKPLLRG